MRIFFGLQVLNASSAGIQILRLVVLGFVIR